MKTRRGLHKPSVMAVPLTRKEPHVKTRRGLPSLFVVLAALLLIAAACGTGDGESSTGAAGTAGTTSTAAPESTDGTASVGTAQTGTDSTDTDGAAGTDSTDTDSTATTAPQGGTTAPEAPKVTPPPSEMWYDTPMIVSFIITDVSMVSAALGWEVPDQGDLETAIVALTSMINGGGGVAGRLIEPKIRVFNAITDDPITEGELCTAITQDDKADFVVLTGQFQENARPCYADAGTTMLDVTLFPIDQVGYDELAPYLWSPLFPSYDTLIEGLADALTANDWLTDASLGVLGIESEMNRRIYENSLLPRIESAGQEVLSVNWIDPATSTSIENGLSQAILRFKQENVDKVIVLGGSRMASYMMDIAGTQNYAPAYAMTSYDSPEFNIRNNPELLVGALGISILPGWDVADDQYPSPANAAEELCLDILSGNGLTYESRNNSRTALLYCDAIMLLYHAGSLAASPSTEDVRAALWEIGDSFEAASVYSVELNENAYAGGAGYRVFAFDESCSCMLLRGDTVPFEN